MSMVMGRALLAILGQSSVETFARTSGLTQGIVRRFVAGETLDEAIASVRDLNSLGIRASLDHLGENTTDPVAAQRATDSYLAALDAIATTNIDANISIKLTALGLDLSTDPCLTNLTTIMQHAAAHNIFVRVDMEGSAYTARTIELVQHVHGTYPLIGTVIQAYLYRSAADIRHLLDAGIRIRLVKGAYREPARLAFPRKRDTDRNYALLMEQLLQRGDYPALATHDELLIERAKQFATDQGIPASRFEFQMLYGIRRDLQVALVRAGYNVRAYVPYGVQWYPYLTRRLAERPANVLFVAGSLTREKALLSSSEMNK